MPQVSYAKHALDCSWSGDMVFLSLWAQVEGGDHGAWPHPSSIPPAVSIGAGIPYCPEPLCGITWCYEIFCLFLSGKSQGLLPWDFCNDICLILLIFNSCTMTAPV